jgi:hypothetical protein
MDFSHQKRGTVQKTITITKDLVTRFRVRREAQVAGYDKIVFHQRVGNMLYVTRGDRSDAAIPAIRIMRAVELVRRNPQLYANGPGISHSSGAGHISDVVWSILHLMTLEQLLA